MACLLLFPIDFRAKSPLPPKILEQNVKSNNEPLIEESTQQDETLDKVLAIC